MARLLNLPTEQLAKTGAEQAKQFGGAAADLTRSKWAIATGPIETDQSAGTFLWVAYRLGEGQWETQSLTTRDSGEIARAGVATQILDFVRRHL